MRYLFDPIFQSTLSVRRATLQLSGEIRHADISIHALRKESDIDNGGILRCGLDISIHALRKESDPGTSVTLTDVKTFQSTLSVRRATPIDIRAQDLISISIHALRKESDGKALAGHAIGLEFQSTLSVRRATRPPHPPRSTGLISIHALRKESDGKAGRRCKASFDFNPRSP